MSIASKLDFGRAEGARETSAAPRIYAVWTRVHATEQMAGRDKFVGAVKIAISEFPHRNFYVRNRLQGRRWRGAAAILRDYVWGQLSGSPRALQVLLHEDPAELARFRADLMEFKPDIVLIDTVRLVAYAQAVRELLPKAKLVIDMDDLMSRRYAELAQMRVPINLGVITKLVPKWVPTLIGKAGIAQSVYKGEANGLAAAEAKLTAIADTVVFASTFEASTYRRSIAGSAHRPKINNVCPPIFLLSDNVAPIEPPLRFIWVGTDGLIQNEQSIRYLLDLWRDRRFKTPLVLYGKMTKQWAIPPNVHFAGFELDFVRIYAPGSVLLAPSFVRGGVKTKVIEAFGYGVPVLGTTPAFEGLDIDYPLAFTDPNRLAEFIGTIDTRIEEFRRAQLIGHEFVARSCTTARFREHWHEIVQDACTASR
ncbi:MAG: glycosyltransferase [Alphaproteobacteria bacterium]